jgi:tRNA(Ile)-lysidine synthase
MLDLFKKYIQSENLFGVEDKILLAVSGGIDSVVMVDLFSKSKFDFGIAHANFCLRANESDEDELFVQKLAKKYKVPFYSEKFETSNFAANEKISIQMAARTLRYEWFKQLLQTYKYTYLATAHHQNDLLETVILNFTKGTGISGFHGILPKRNQIIRPLLFAEKEDLRDYLAENYLAYREDSSNESNKYQRNLIRNEVVPILKQINPNLEVTISETVQKVIVAENEFYTNLQVWKDATLIKKGDVCEISMSGALSKPLLFLAELLKEYNFTYPTSQQIYDNLENPVSGSQHLSPTHKLQFDRDKLILSPKNIQMYGSILINTTDELVSIQDFNLTLKHSDWKKGNSLKTKPNAQLFDLSTLQFPLKLRMWKEGDWFIPLGMNGKKKVSDFFIDQKIPLIEKQKTWVLTSKDSIVWIVGHRIDNRFKITDTTEKVVEIKVDKL